MIAAIGGASGCITTPDWSQDSDGSQVLAQPPRVATSPTTVAPSMPRPQVSDFHYVDGLTVPQSPELWIHRPEPVIASQALLADAEATRLLATAELSQVGRRAALLERARARETLWRLNDALADLDAARRLQSGDVEVELERAWLLGALSRTAESVALMPDLFRLEQNSQDSARVLGLIRFQEGRFAEAAAALGFHVEDPAASADLRLLQVMADARANGKLGQKWVLDALTTGPAVRWPGPIAGYLLGRLDARALIDAAALAPVFPPAGAVCQAWFYVGQNELLQGNRADAVKALLAAVHTRATSAVEYRLATAGLIHLGVLTTNSLPGTPGW